MNRHDDELENLARAIGMREWHTDQTIHVDFGSYFWVNPVLNEVAAVTRRLIDALFDGTTVPANIQKAFESKAGLGSDCCARLQYSSAPGRNETETGRPLLLNNRAWLNNGACEICAST